MGNAGELVRYINLKLAALGQPTSAATTEPYFLDIARPLLRNYYQKDQLLGDRLCPVDARIQAFLERYLGAETPRLPSKTFVLDRPGLVRAMSLPPGQDRLHSPYLESYRVRQGILHNPRSDRRTTKGIFHIVEGGFPIPADKIAVPKRTFASLLALALDPPAEVLSLPFTADQQEQVRLFASLLLRPMVCPATGREPAKSMEIRFFAPGSLVSNLDFIESIFGNGGDPDLPENDAALDGLHWDGADRVRHSGPAPGGRAEERCGPAALRGRDGPAAPRRHVLARGRRTLQRRQRVQTGVPRPLGRDADDHRRQLLRLLQERG